MATEVITNAELQIIDNMAIITLPKGIENNCQYEIRLKNFQSEDGTAVLDNPYVHKVITELTPNYVKVSEVAILKDTYHIPESTILYYARSASEYVDYIIDVSGNNSPNEFAKKQFVRIKTMIDCLLNAYASKAAGSGIKGKLGEISFEDSDKYSTSIDDLLDDLWTQLKHWEDALKGYELEGRAKMKFAVKASQTAQSTDFSEVVDSLDRTLATPIR